MCAMVVLMSPEERTRKVRVLSEEEVAEILEPFGGIEAVMERGRRFDADLRWAEAHREELKQQYPDQWLGIARQQVLAHADTPEEVRDQLDAAGEDVSSTVLHHARVKEQLWALRSQSRCRG